MAEQVDEHFTTAVAALPDSAQNRSARLDDPVEPASTLSVRQAMDLFDAQLGSRHLDRCSLRSRMAMSTAMTGSTRVATTAVPLGVVRSPVCSRAYATVMVTRPSPHRTSPAAATTVARGQCHNQATASPAAASSPTASVIRV